MSARPQPIRTCIACRRTGSKAGLLRVVRSPEGTVSIDRTGRAPGRGAYLHASEGCVRAGFGRGGMSSALRVRLDPPGAARLMDEALEALKALGDER